MKSIVTTWAVLVLAGLMIANIAPSPFIIQISSHKQVYKVGQEIKLDLTLMNVSDREITVGCARGEAAAELSYSFEVRKANGSLEEETEYLRELTGKPKDPKHIVIFNSSFSQVTLKPGESLQEHAVLTKLYALGKPGNYTVQVSHPIPEQLGSTVKSKTFTITITK